MGASKILIVDDDKIVLSIVESHLSESGFETCCAKNGKEGLEQAERYNPDVIILDWIMPDMDGNEVLKHLQDNDQTRHIPVIMLTGRSEVHDISESLKLGARDYIVKPFDKDNLVIRVKKLIEKMKKTGEAV